MQLVMPAMVLVLFGFGYVARMMRASMSEVMHSNYIRTAMLRGLPFRRVITHHALRNALIAPFTVIILQINWLLSGVIVVEFFFAYRGFGALLLEASLTQDIRLLQGPAPWFRWWSQSLRRPSPTSATASSIPGCGSHDRGLLPPAARRRPPSGAAEGADQPGRGDRRRGGGVLVHGGPLCPTDRALRSGGTVHSLRSAGRFRAGWALAHARHRSPGPRHPFADHLRRTEGAVFRGDGDLLGICSGG